MAWRLAADALLVLHVAVVAFIVGGLFAILLGGLRGWGWVHGLRFRVLHLVAIGVVVLQAWLGRLCPLTTWEMALRARAGDTTYAGSFVAHWLGELLYVDVPLTVLALLYSLFGAAVLAAWWLVPVRRRRDNR